MNEILYCNGKAEIEFYNIKNHFIFIDFEVY